MKDLIYCQRDIPKDKWRYGLRSSAAVGCGWVATHNALRLMGYETDIEQLIRYYEWQLPLIHGNAGTSFWGPAVCFRNWGFPVNMTVNRKEFDRVAKESDVCILFYRWREKWKLGAHFCGAAVPGRHLHRLQYLPQFHRPRPLWGEPGSLPEEKALFRRIPYRHPEKGIKNPPPPGGPQKRNNP